MKKKVLTVCTYIAVLVLEILPYGAVLNFANPEGEPYRHTYSYFSLTPFGYANFGPFLTALLTCVLLLLTVINIFRERPKTQAAVCALNIVAVITSLMPLMFGIDYVTVIGVCITVLLALGVGITFINKIK